MTAMHLAYSKKQATMTTLHLVTRLFRLTVCCGGIMMIVMMVMEHKKGVREELKEKETSTSNKQKDKEKEVNNLHQAVHARRLNKHKLAKLSHNQSVVTFLRKGKILRQNVLNVILLEENKKVETKDKVKKLETKTMIYNRINKSGSTSLLGKKFL